MGDVQPSQRAAHLSKPYKPLKHPFILFALVLSCGRASLRTSTAPFAASCPNHSNEWASSPSGGPYSPLHSQEPPYVLQSGLDCRICAILPRQQCERGRTSTSSKEWVSPPSIQTAHARPFVGTFQCRSWNHYVVLGAILWSFIAKN